MKEFNLEQAKQGKPVCTRGGRKARIICFDARFPQTGNIVALVEKENGEEIILYYYDNGRCNIGSDYDLIMTSEKHEGWVNVLNHGNNDTYVGNTIYATKELADEAFSRMNECKRVATVKISWEE